MKVENKVASMLNLPSMESKEAPASAAGEGVARQTQKKDLELKNSFYELDLKDVPKKQDFASEFGFRTDEKGFFDERFNMAARIPKSYKIDLANVRAISAQLDGGELMHTINSYFVSISSINSQFKENNVLQKGDISKLVAGFSSDTKLTKLYKDDESLQKALLQNKNLASLNLHNNITSFHFDKALSNSAKDPLLKPFIKSDGSIEGTGLLLNFIREDLSAKKAQAKFFKEPLNLDFSVQNFKEFIDKGSESFLEKNNSKSMSFDLFLYMNSVDKNTLDADKLDVLYDQYKGYKSRENMKEFMSESSIYTDYINEKKPELEGIRKDFLKDNDEENLKKVDEDIKKGNEHYIKQKSTELRMEKAIKAYIASVA